MTTALITLDQAKEHLRITGTTAYDTDVQEKTVQASWIVLDYLKYTDFPSGWDVETGDSPELAAAPALVQAATLLVLGELFVKREAKEVDLLSLGVTRILERYRDPTLA